MCNIKALALTVEKLLAHGAEWYGLFVVFFSAFQD